MDSGYFNDEAKEYVITDMFPRRKWLNYLWNDTAVCACDQFGFGVERNQRQAARNRGRRAEFNVARQLRLLKEKNAESLNVFMLNCPDKYVDSVANIWLKRQLSLGKDWGRLYGRGFRDVMQDTSAFVSLDPALAGIGKSVRKKRFLCLRGR